MELETVTKKIDQVEESIVKADCKIEGYGTQKQSLQTEIENAEGDEQELCKLQKAMEELDIGLKHERVKVQQLRDIEKLLRE